MTSPRYSAGPDPDPTFQAWRAARDFIAAADRVRVAWRWTIDTFGEDAIEHAPLPPGGTPVGLLLVFTARDRCEALGAWDENPWQCPDVFYEGRANGAARPSPHSDRRAP